MDRPPGSPATLKQYLVAMGLAVIFVGASVLVRAFLA